MEVEMRIRGLMMDPVTNMPIVILRDVNGNAVLPIWVGIFEANAIALEIEKVTLVSAQMKCRVLDQSRCILRSRSFSLQLTV